MQSFREAQDGVTNAVALYYSACATVIIGPIPPECFGLVTTVIAGSMPNFFRDGGGRLLLVGAALRCLTGHGLTKALRTTAKLPWFQKTRAPERTPYPKKY